MRARWVLLTAGLGLLLGLLLPTEVRSEVSPGLRIAASLVGAGLISLRWLLRHAAPRRQQLATLALVLWAGLSIGGTAGHDAQRVASGGKTYLWSHYHYYLGSKYFAELGYDQLYEQTVAVDREDPSDRFIHSRRIRDLRTYRKQPMQFWLRHRSQAFSDARWQAFVHDVRWFDGKLDWDHILIDRGYNAPPSGTFFYQQLARLPLNDRNMRALSLLDAGLLLGAFGLVGWAMGPVRALVGAAGLCLWLGNEHRVVGYPFQYDYYVALLLMLVAWHKQRPGVAGALLGYATMVRVFPGFLWFGLLAWAVGRWWRVRQLSPALLRMAGGFALSAVVLASLGCFAGRGPGAWQEWAGKIGVHSAQHRIGDKRLGLQHLFTYTPGPVYGRWPTKQQRAQAYQRREGLWQVGAALLGLCFLASALRSGARNDPPQIAAFLGMALVFAAVVLSRYYGSVLCLVFLIGTRERDGPGWGDLPGAGLLLLVAAFYALGTQVEGRYAPFLIANALLLGWWLAVLALTAWRGPTGLSDHAAPGRDAPALCSAPR